MANIREHCSWVHSKQKEDATQKAKDIVRMSVARTIKLEPLEEFDLPVNKACLVVGGGVAGMTSALSLAEQGFEVHLVERNSELGGVARRIQSTLEGLDVQAFLGDLIRKVYQHPLIRISHEATITDVSGYVGNFVTTVETEGQVKTIEHGAAILATGAAEYKPTEYLYGEDERVLTQLELEERLAEGEESLTDTQSLVMIQCVGCREENSNYCARVCCSQAIKNALALKKIKPEMKIYILFRDMRTYGFKEDYYLEAAEKDVKFIRCGSCRGGGPACLAGHRTRPHSWPEVGRGRRPGRPVGRRHSLVRQCGNRPKVQGGHEPGRVLPGSARQTAAG